MDEALSLLAINMVEERLLKKIQAGTTEGKTVRESYTSEQREKLFEESLIEVVQEIVKELAEEGMLPDSLVEKALTAYLRDTKKRMT